MAEKTVRVRFAPSPTGFLHIGNLRSALYNELFARRHNGKFVLRIEDTDLARTVPGATQALCRVLKALDLVPDEGVWINLKGELVEHGPFGPYTQSKRLDHYRAYAQELIALDKAYYCFCTERDLQAMREEQQATGQASMYNRRCRGMPRAEASKRIKQGAANVIRLAIPTTPPLARGGAITFTDEIRKDVSVAWSQVDDQIILKSDGMPTYHLAATCDDHDMQITHVIRGEEWISSTPKHLFIYEAFGWTPPAFAHLPLLLNTDRSKLSKRQGDIMVEDFLAQGYLKDALLNFVALLGWNPRADREIYSHNELRQLFDLRKINKSGAIVNFEKLNWLNRHYLRSLDQERYLELAKPYLEALTTDIALLDRVALLMRERLTKLKDLAEVCAPFLQTRIEVDPNLLPWKSQTQTEAGLRLGAVLEVLKKAPKRAWANPEAMAKPVRQLIDSRSWSNGEVLWPLRVALSGERHSPGPFELLTALGKERSLLRLEQAIKVLE